MLASVVKLSFAGPPRRAEVSLEKLITDSDVVLIGRVASSERHHYPPALIGATEVAAAGLPYLTIDVDETLHPKEGGPKPGARIQIFDPISRRDYERAALARADVPPRVEAIYRSAVPTASVTSGARLIVFLTTAPVPAHFPGGSFMMAAGTAYEDARALPRVRRLLALPEWKRCPNAGSFGCSARSQGVAPERGESVPEFCGCIPRCPRSKPVLITFEGSGRWPDGSFKGNFSCATEGIP